MIKELIRRELCIEHTRSLTDDVDFYSKLCEGKKSLELFAGYGRITNRLVDQNIDVEAIDINPSYAAKIHLPTEKCHVCDVREFASNQRFEAIFAAYNSFTLLTSDKEIHAFFKNMADLMKKDGILCLNNYHHSAWDKAVAYSFTRDDGSTVRYWYDFDLSLRDKSLGFWRDHYTLESGETLMTTIQVINA